MKPVFATILLILVAPAAIANEWSMIPGQSTLAFESSYDGDRFTGVFKRFSATVHIDMDDPGKSLIDVSIELNSVDTHNEERDGTLVSEDFFWAEHFPTAHFKTTTCAAGSTPGTITCQAQLTIRDKTVAIVFPFQFVAQGANAGLKASVSLDRMAFDVGTGDWADAELIPHQVEVKVDLQLAPSAR